MIPLYRYGYGPMMFGVREAKKGPMRMTPNVYDGEPDDRQATDAEPAVVPTRFRPRYRALTETEKTLHDDIKAQAEELERLYNQIPEGGRYKSLAITALEESVMWAVKELTK